MSPFYFCLVEDYFSTLAAQLDFIPEDVSVIRDISFLFEVKGIFIIDGIIQLSKFEDLANHAITESNEARHTVAFYEVAFWESISRFASRIMKFEFKRALIDQRNYKDTDAIRLDEELKQEVQKLVCRFEDCYASIIEE